jgi:hypothetical protein
MIARARREIGLSFISVVATDRESHDGQGHNRVAGPDFQWRWKNEVVTGQWLYSHSQTPARPDLAREWTGGRLSGHALSLAWSHSTARFDASADYRDLGDGFRADAGFVPQVGLRRTSGDLGWTSRPTGAVRRVRMFLAADRQIDRTGAVISESVTPGLGLDVKWNGFLQVRAINDRTSTGDVVLTRRQLGFVARFSPSRRIAQVSIDGVAGQEIDFANARRGRGSSLNAFARVNPTGQLEMEALVNRRILHLEGGRRLFLARVARVRATYLFRAGFFIRIVGQHVATTRDPGLYVEPVQSRSETLSGSALLAYKINWQSVLFIGYGDDHELSTDDRLQPASRQFFVKMSYAFQR